MNILYLSCHSILEYDEVKILFDLGYSVFSPGGAYQNPINPGDMKRPGIANGKYFDHLVSVAIQCSKENLHYELVEWADVVVVMHRTDWILNNWKYLKDKKVIWRTIGQSIASTESELRSVRQEMIGGRRILNIVRYSPMEQQIPGYIGEDALIRFYKDPTEYGNWNGKNPIVMTVGQDMVARRDHLMFDVFDRATQGMERRLFGNGNESSGIKGGLVDYEGLKTEMRDNRVFFYTGTRPASYTLTFIEAMMTGIPIVSIGSGIGNRIYDINLFEVPLIIENGVNGFVSDNEEELRRYVRILLEDHDLARKIGEAGRQTAIKIFGYETIKSQWKTYLESLMPPKPQ